MMRCLRTSVRPVKPARGFTLVEMLMVCALAGVLAMLAWPAWQTHLLRAARIDAVDALTRVQVAQEAHRGLHGLYSADLRALRGTYPISPQGRYAIAVASTGPDSYRAVARAQGAQSADHDCAELSLSVDHGFASNGPNVRCWNR